MNKPASAPDVIPPRPPAEPAPGDDAEGSNAVQHAPDPQAQPLPSGEHKYIPKSPYPARQ